MSYRNDCPCTHHEYQQGEEDTRDPFYRTPPSSVASHACDLALDMATPDPKKAPKAFHDRGRLNRLSAFSPSQRVLMQAKVPCEKCGRSHDRGRWRWTPVITLPMRKIADYCGVIVRGFRRRERLS